MAQSLSHLSTQAFANFQPRAERAMAEGETQTSTIVD